MAEDIHVLEAREIEPCPDREEREAGFRERSAALADQHGIERALEGEDAVTAHDTVYAKRFPTSHLPEDDAHIYVAPIGSLNEAKTKDQMMYYRSVSGHEEAR